MERCKIKAAVRLRPLNDRERHGEPRPVWTVDDRTLTSPAGSYTYDHVFDGTANNWNVYEEVGRPIIDAFLQGFNATLFAYGQTASGKTHTIMGENDEPGMIPLALSEIFHYMETQSDHREFILRCAYLEIYNEVLTDLLDIRPGSGKKVTIKEDPQGRVHVKGMCEQRILNGHEALQLLLRGEEARRFAATAMNDRSSRSHTIYRLTLESKEIGGDMVKVSVLHLVDLAGSEKAHHSADQQRFKEGVKINLSLLHLGIVMAKLSNGEAHIPFRESKLTRILESSIGGNAKTTIVCTVSPLMTEETLSTLKFASRAMQIQNEAQVNEVPTSQEALLKKLKKVEEENRQLRMKISDADQLEKKKVKFESLDRVIPHHREKEKISRRQTVCPSSVGQLDSSLMFSHFASEAFSPKMPSRTKHSSDRRMSFFPIATADRYSLTSTDDEEDFSLHNSCDIVDEDALDAFQLDTTIPFCEVGKKSYTDMTTQTCLELVDTGKPFGQIEKGVQTENGCLSLDLLHCGVQTDEVEVPSKPILLAQDNSNHKVDISTQTLETMDNLRENVEADFKYQLEGMRRDCESMYQQMSLLEAEKVELVRFRDVTEQEKEQLVGQCDYERLEAIVQLESANEEVAKLSLENQELQKKLDAAVSQIEEQRTKNGDLQGVLDRRDMEVQSLKEKLHCRQNDLENALASQALYDEAIEFNKVLMEKCESTVLESEMLAHMREQLEEATAALESEVALRRMAEGGYLETREKMCLLKSELAELVTFRDGTEHEKEQLLGQIMELKTKNNELKEVLGRRDVELQILMNKCDEIAESRKVLMEKCENAVQESEMHAHMREQMSSLEAEKVELVNFRDVTEHEKEQLLGQIEELKSGNDELKDIMDKRDVEMQSLKEKYDEATEVNKVLMEKCESAVLESEMVAHMREQLEEATAAKEEEAALRRMNEEGYLELKEKMSLLEAEKVELVRFRDITEQEKEQLAGQIEELKTGSDELKDVMDKRDVEMQSLKEKYDEATEVNKVLMEKCESAVLESEMVAHMREQLEEATAAKEEEAALRRMKEEGYLEMKEKMSLLEAEKVELVRFRDATEQEKEQLLRQIEELKTGSDELKDIMDKRDVEMQSLKEKYDEATEVNKVLMEKCESAVLESEMVAHMREQLEKATAAKEEEAALRRTNEEGYLEMKEKMSSLEAEKVELVNFRDATEHEKEQLLGQIEELKSGNDELKDIMDKRDVEMQSLKEKYDEATEVNKVLMEKCESAVLESEMVAHMREQLEKATAAKEEEAALRRMNEEGYLEMKEKMSLLESEMAELITFRDATEQEKEQLLGQIEELKTGSDELKDVMDKRDVEMQSLKEKYDEATEVNKVLMEKCESAVLESEMVAHMREQLEEATAAKEEEAALRRMKEEGYLEMKEKFDGLTSSCTALEQDLTSSKEQCESLQKNLKKIVEMKRKMEWQRDDAGRQLDDLEEKMEEIAADNETLKHEAQAARNRCDELSSSHTALKQELSSSKAECESLTKNLKKIVEMKNKMEWQRDDASRQLDDLEEKMEEWTLEMKKLSEIKEERDSQLLRAQDRIARLERMHQEKENLPQSEPGLSGSFAQADVEELRKKLKTVIERSRTMECQRNEEARKVDELSEKLESVLLQNKQLSAERKDEASTQQLGANAQDPIGHGCGLSLEYETYQLRSQLGECKRKEEKLTAICKQMQSEHRSALAKKDKQIEQTRKELERLQQECEALKRRAAPLSCTSKETAGVPHRRVFQEQNVTAKPTSVKPKVTTSTAMPQMSRGGMYTQPGKKEQPPFQWDETVNKSVLESENCNQQ